MSKTRNLPIATFVNMTTVIIGSLIGVSLQQVFPENIEAIIFQAIGLGTLLIGFLMAFKIPDGFLLIFIFSLILGGIFGELLGVQKGLLALGDWLKNSFQIGEENFTEGLVTAFLLFCIGSMTIVGAIEEGLSGKRELLLIKSLLDGITSIAFASTYGIGVLFSIFPMLIIQGGITLLAAQAHRFITDQIIGIINAVGGALIIGIGINLLKLGRINVENLLPAIVVGILLTYLYEKFQKRKASST